MKHCLIAMCFCAIAVNWALAQHLDFAAYVHDNVTSQDSGSDVIAKKGSEAVLDPQSLPNRLPATMTVRTAALLELHAMRKSAVNLCLQLPTKYRTRLPECADIFKHEIRLQTLAKEQK